MVRPPRRGAIADYALVVTSPGFPPGAPVLAAAAAAGVPIWGDVELAWRLDAAGHYGPPRRWLVVTGTNGKTTTTSMLHAMLVAAGRRAVLCGNIGNPVLDVLAEPAELLAVELSSFQLFWAPSLRPEAGVGAQRRRGPPRLARLFGRLCARQGARADRAGGRRRARRPARGRAAGQRRPRRCGSVSGSASRRRANSACATGMLVDRAFAGDASCSPAASIPVAGPVGVLDALAAAALARAVGVPPAPSPRRWPRSASAGTAPRWWPSTTA